jgi:putative heme-binding domain-containing protein
MSNGRFVFSFFLLSVLTFAGFCLEVVAWQIPHGQSKPPNEPRSATEALKHFEVPEGFSVEIVACEPDIINPVAMTFDHRGRIWITESIEYPRREAGAGRDRIKILEDTDGDGRIDSVKIFAEGLNIPSGIAVGHGGVWVANSPDILFMQDTDGDDRADKIETVVTGFGRDDTHELPNSLTWGPDGYLYGLNGVFNYSHVKQDDREYKFTCALFRIHPRTRKFELFCEGTSNPWGVAWDPLGNAFVSACVIDHLWHLTETGYYIRQGGPYPPFVSKIGSIVDHLHQQRAYCGLHYFDSHAYPAEYRDRLYMGNIHGNCLNVDRLERAGSTYFSHGEPDFLQANDSWFMPVVQKTGPDGCLYVLDWYDRYHCYQDANRDPQGIDRLKGRLYRIRYQDTPRAKPFDLSTESNEQLLARLSSTNVFYRDLAQRMIVERGNAAPIAELQKFVLDDAQPIKYRLHALWSLVSLGPLEKDFAGKLLTGDEYELASWAVRASGNHAIEDQEISQLISELSTSPSADVRLQVAIAARKLPNVNALPLLLSVLNQSHEDKLIPQIVWQNLHPLIAEDTSRFVQLIAPDSDQAEQRFDLNRSAGIQQLSPQIVERLLAINHLEPGIIVRLATKLSSSTGGADSAKRCFRMISERIRSGELDAAATRGYQAAFASQPPQGNESVQAEFALLAALWKDHTAIEKCLSYLNDTKAANELRIGAARSLIYVHQPGLHKIVAQILTDRNSNSVGFRGELINAVSASSDPEMTSILVDQLNELEPELVPRLIEALIARVDSSKLLLQRIGEKKLAANSLNANQVRGMLNFRDAELKSLIEKNWGTIRTERDADREQFVGAMRKLILNNAKSATASRGELVYTKICAQCHKLHGKGEEVGPDITGNGRGSFDQLLSNVFDPSLVIGSAYQATNVVTLDGLSVIGLLVEESPERVVLKGQGGKLSVIARADIDEMYRSELSLMPEGIEKQLTEQEIADLFAYLSLDKHPDDAQAKYITGAPEFGK